MVKNGEVTGNGKIPGDGKSTPQNGSAKRPRQIFQGVVNGLGDRGIQLFLAAAVLIFVLYPLLCIVKKSLWLDGQISLAEYENLFSENAVLLRHSFFTATVSGILSTILGLLIALKTVTTRGKKKAFYMAILMMTMVSPPFISSLMYIQLYGRRGWITYRLLKLSINPYNKWGIIAMQSLHFASLNALFTIGILEKMDHRLLHASRDLGATPNRTLLEVVLPLLRPAILVCFILSFIRSLADFGTPMVIGGRYNTLASEIYLQLIGYARLEKASAMNMLLLAPAIAAFIAYRFLMRRSDAMVSPEVGRAKGGGSLPLRPRGLLNWVLGVGSGLFYLMMVMQYACIFLTGFLKSKKGVYYFSLDNFNNLLGYNLDSLQRSVKYALVVAVVGTLFGMLLTYYLERRRIRFGGVIDFLSSMPYLLPGTCFGIGYILAFNHGPLKLTGTASIIIINMLFKQLPAVTKICSASLAQINRRMEDAARDLGAGKVYVIKDIVFPNLRQAFVTGFIYNFTSSMTTAGAILFLISANHKMAVYTLFDAINSGEYGVASLISSMIIVITLAVSGLVSAFVLRREQNVH